MRVGENVDLNSTIDIKELVEKYYSNPEGYFELKDVENTSKSASENATSQSSENASESQKN